jgi:hypothetical protein
MVQQGYVYLAQPPLYLIKKGKEAEYAYNEEQRKTLITKLGQVRKETGISVSNVYVQGTQTNGLSAFEGGNKEILPEDILLVLLVVKLLPFKH